jgi:hypothetical protein
MLPEPTTGGSKTRNLGFGIPHGDQAAVVGRTAVVLDLPGDRGAPPVRYEVRRG